MWGWACAHCGIAFKGELRDACPDCGHFGKRAVYETDVVAECDKCGTPYFGCSACPICARGNHERTATLLVQKFNLEWEEFFNGLPSFAGWVRALEGAKKLAQRQRRAAMELTRGEA